MVFTEKLTQTEAARRLGVPIVTCNQWIKKEERERRGYTQDKVGSAGVVTPDYLSDVRLRMAERDARNALRPSYDVNIDMLGDPPPGRSALDAKYAESKNSDEGFPSGITLAKSVSVAEWKAARPKTGGRPKGQSGGSLSTWFD